MIFRWPAICISTSLQPPYPLPYLILPFLTFPFLLSSFPRFLVSPLPFPLTLPTQPPSPLLSPIPAPRPQSHTYLATSTLFLTSPPLPTHPFVSHLFTPHLPPPPLPPSPSSPTLHHTPPHPFISHLPPPSHPPKKTKKKEKPQKAPNQLSKTYKVHETWEYRCDVMEDALARKQSKAEQSKAEQHEALGCGIWPGLKGKGAVRGGVMGYSRGMGN